MKTTKLAPYSISPTLQRFFTYSALTAFVLPAGFQVYLAISQYASNPNLSSYYWVTLYLLAAPLAFFIIAFVLSDKKKSAMSRLFISTFLAASAMMVLTAASTVSSSVSQFTTGFSVFGDAFWDWIMLEAVIMLAIAVLYTVFLLAIRRKANF